MRVLHQPVYLLNQYPYSESSLLVDVFSRDFGRVMLLAKGARRLKSRVRGVLRPFSPILVSWSGKRDLFTLTGAESRQSITRMPWSAVLCCYYMNELMIKFMQRLDAHEALFDHYEKSVQAIANGGDNRLVLRCFEVSFLREIGYELRLDTQFDGITPVDGSGLYTYDPLRGPVPSSHGGPMAYHGSSLLELNNGLPSTARTMAESRRLLQQVLDFYLEGRVVRSRKTFEEVRKYISDNVSR